MYYKVNAPELKARSNGHVINILAELANIPREFLDGEHHACPWCGGKDRFRLLNSDTGAVLCNQCFHHKNGDFISAVQHANNEPFPNTLQRIAGFLDSQAHGVGNTEHSATYQVSQRSQLYVIGADPACVAIDCAASALGASDSSRRRISTSSSPRYGKLQKSQAAPLANDKFSNVQMKEQFPKRRTSITK